MTLDTDRVLREVKDNISYYAFAAARVTGMEFDDAWQELSIGVWKAVGLYDSRKSAPKTFFINVIKRHFIFLLRCGRSGKAMTSLKAMRPDATEYGWHFVGDRREHFTERVETKHVFDLAQRDLGDTRAGAVLAMLRQGFDLKDIGKALNISRENAFQITARNVKPAIARHIITYENNGGKNVHRNGRAARKTVAVPEAKRRSRAGKGRDRAGDRVQRTA